MMKIFTMVHEKIPSTKDLLTAIHESWNHIDKDYYFKSEKSMSEKINVIKTPRRVTEY